MLLRIALAVINLGVPGAGTILAGITISGVLQLLLWMIAVLLALTGVPLIVVGFPLYIVAVLWAVFSVLVSRNLLAAPRVKITG